MHKDDDALLLILLLYVENKLVITVMPADIITLSA
jgi:hypothetical protein